MTAYVHGPLKKADKVVLHTKKRVIFLNVVTLSMAINADKNKTKFQT